MNDFDVPEGLRFAATCQIDFELDQKSFRWFLGSSGRHLHEIEERTRTHAQLDQSTKTLGYSMLQLRGKWLYQKRAVGWISQKLAEIDPRFEAMRFARKTINLEVKQRLVGCLLGKDNVVKKSIEKESLAWLEFDQSTKGEGYSTISVDGVWKHQQTACMLIARKVTEANRVHFGLSHDSELLANCSRNRRRERSCFRNAPYLGSSCSHSRSRSRSYTCSSSSREQSASLDIDDSSCIDLRSGSSSSSSSRSPDCIRNNRERGVRVATRERSSSWGLHSVGSRLRGSARDTAHVPRVYQGQSYARDRSRSRSCRSTSSHCSQIEARASALDVGRKGSSRMLNGQVGMLVAYKDPWMTAEVSDTAQDAVKKFSVVSYDSEAHKYKGRCGRNSPPNGCYHWDSSCSGFLNKTPLTPHRLLCGRGHEILCRFVDNDASVHSFRLYIPPDFDPNGKPWPLLLFLHGSQGGTAIGSKLKALRKGDALPNAPGAVFAAKHFVMISPECKWRWYATPEMWVVRLVRSFLPAVWCDSARVYCTGLSMGGMGCWELVSRAEGIFSAVAPVGAYHRPERRQKIVEGLSNTPAFVVQAPKDKRCPIEPERQLLEELEAHSNMPVIKKNVSGGHGDLYKQAYIKDTELWQWLLTQSHGRGQRQTTL